MPEEDILYHYTSVDALYNIITTKKLWLVNSKSSNDKTEDVLNEDDFNHLIKRSREKAPENDKEIFDKIFCQTERTLEAEPEDEYIFCLSKIEDSLARWDRYADYRKGVCLHIDISQLKKIYDMLDLIYYEYFKIYELGYTEDVLINEILTIFDGYKRTVRDLGFSGKFNDRKNEYIIGARKRLHSSLCSKKKKPYFQDEKEVRIIYKSSYISFGMDFVNCIFNSEGMKSRHLDFLHKLDLEKLYFASIRGEIRGMHHLNLSQIWGSDLIPEIMLEPNCSQNAGELRAFLNAHGLKETTISVSKIPIR